ncbi:carcinine hydrolase/isopenicillin-N N-acyltransferase family protein [Sulfurimonas sp.]|uniref:carcinine hydrolase/isopenicillin-N N-acyltransferase family protein n=1 Tax=Sulfurimonas sp. TaxID=2022749 RepID=UPI003D0AD63B
MFENNYKTIKKVQEKRVVYFEANEVEKTWQDVIDKDSETMKELCVAMSNLVYEIGVPKFLVHLSAKILYHLVYKRWGHYTSESDYLATKCPNMSRSMLAFLQRQYTLAHMGCSVVMAWDEVNQEMICFRSLDWKGADDIAKATRVFSFVNNNDQEVAKVAGITAMTGVLTGAKKGFSVAINYAPWKRSAKFKSDPTFLIRQLLEDESITTYAQAHEKVKEWEVGSPCFISICGVNKGEACVVELGSGETHFREIGEDDFIIQTNHYDLTTSPFTQHNQEPYTQEMNEQEWYSSELLQNSQKREKIIRKMLEEKNDVDIKTKLINIYKTVPVLNYETAQWVVMQPKSEEIEVYSCFDK